MKTNSKEVKEKIRQFLIDAMNDSCYVADGYTPADNPEEQAKTIVKEFKSWYCPYEKQRTPNLQLAFKDWLQGLPSCISLPWTNYDIMLAVAGWLGQTEEETEKYEYEKTETLFYYLVYREFLAICKNYKVEF